MICVALKPTCSVFLLWGSRIRKLILTYFHLFPNRLLETITLLPLRRGIGYLKSPCSTRRTLRLLILLKRKQVLEFFHVLPTAILLNTYFFSIKKDRKMNLVI